jgi:hypothetical protein
LLIDMERLWKLPLGNQHIANPFETHREIPQPECIEPVLAGQA